MNTRPRHRMIATAGAAVIASLVLCCCTPVAPDSSSQLSSVTKKASRQASPAPSKKQSSKPSSRPPSRAATTTAAQPSAKRALALDVLALLMVKGRAPMTGYERDEFGPAWTDTDHNGCDTRNDVLRRDLSGETFRAGTRDCVVMSGRLLDPYTNKVLTFAKAEAGEIQIDHVVALGNGWVTGAARWPDAKRLAFANDPLNLLAVDGPANASKGAGDAATWLPPNKAYRCSYVARQVAVKHKYGLWVTSAERAAMGRVLHTCTRQHAPGGGNPTVASSKSSKPATTTGGTAKGGKDPRFEGCSAAIEAGYGPYKRGRDPEYGWYDDSDDDGTVCEH